MPDEAANDIEFVELFCGIGGFAESLTGAGIGRVNVAVDINQNALDVYRLNFPHQTLCKTIESISIAESESWSNKSWWMSPPCQPHSIRGQQNDLDDPRSLGFLNILRLIEAHRPPELALENVPGFKTSQSHSRLIEILDRLGYTHQQITLCPTQFGHSNRRSRFYLIAGLTAPGPWSEIRQKPYNSIKPIRILDWAQLEICKADQIAYANALDVNDKTDAARSSACFTSAYGRSKVRSGSYLRTETGIRRYSPQEILDELGFRPTFSLPNWSYRRLWPLIGNSLSIPVVRYITSHFPR